MRLVLSAVLAAAAAAALLSDAQAQTRRRAVFVPPVIHGRSFLDSGPQAPVGSQSNYVLLSTTLNAPVYRSYLPDSFGQSSLPSRFNNPGRAQPVARFFTPAY